MSGSVIRTPIRTGSQQMVPQGPTIASLGDVEMEIQPGDDDAPVFKAEHAEATASDAGSETAAETEVQGGICGCLARANKLVTAVLMTPLIPDGPWILPPTLTVGEHKMIPRYFITTAKFLVYSFFFTKATHRMIREMEYEHDPIYNWEDLIMYDLHPVALDLFMFFVVGRLWAKGRCGVDSIGFILPSCFGAWFFSAMAEWSWARHNVSMYQIHCAWPPELFMFVGCGLFAFAFVVIAHVYHGYKDGILFGRLIEFALSVCVFALPIASSPFFHFHHWFAAWLLGMHINQKYWWSYVVMALCFGVYINGIAGYGRDSMLGCKSAYYNSQQQQCGHLAGDVDNTQFCFFEELPTGHNNVSLAPDAGIVEGNGTAASNETSTVPENNMFMGFGEAVPLDWRNCSATGGH